MMPAYEHCDLGQLGRITEIQTLLKNGNFNTFFSDIEFLQRSKLNKVKDRLAHCKVGEC